MKVGIVTMPLGLNFGGMMQNWAMQRVLQRLGHSPITIRCDWSGTTTLWHDLTRFLFRNSKGIIKSLFGHPFRLQPVFPNKIRRVNAEFLNANIILSEPCVSIKPIEGCDAYIVGSDQVWRPDFVKDIYDMYLRFVDSGSVLKLAYSASFGTDYWGYSVKQTGECRKLIKDFKAVSVRELSGKALCKDNLNRDVAVTLDPTLLVDVDDYCRLAECVPMRNYDVGVYILDPTRDKENIIDGVCQEIGSRRCNINPYRSSVEDWIAMFRDSSFVVTDSFHGCVFSIIFKKNFVAIGNAERGLTRFFDLLEPLGLKNRVLNDASNLHDLVAVKINWSEVDDILNIRRLESIDFLKTNLN